MGSSQSPGRARGFSIGAGALAIALSFLVMVSFAGAVFVSHIRNSTLNNRNRNHHGWTKRKKNADDKKYLAYRHLALTEFN